MDRTQAIDNALNEARGLHGAGAPPGSFFWQFVIDQLETLKEAGEDFEVAYPLYKGIGRTLVDQTTERPPAIAELMRVMENWRRARKRGWK